MTDTLLVPMELDALVVNEKLKDRDTFRYWTFNYDALDKFKSPEPMGIDLDMTEKDSGVYLHWTLPRFLRSGRVGGARGNQGYPLVPNRWLIVRMSRQSSSVLKAWVLESDCPVWCSDATESDCPVPASTPPEIATQSSSYLVDADILALWQNCPDGYRNKAEVTNDSTDPQYANLGISFEQQSWRERSEKTMFLTAVAPGNAEFSVYTAHNMNIFSFYDDLKSIDKDTLSYFVVGWYSDSSKDIVTADSDSYTGGKTVEEVLDILEWTIAGGTSPAMVTRSLFTGMSFSLDWDRNGSPPDNDMLLDIQNNQKLNVVIGNSTIDAFSTLLGKQLPEGGDLDSKIALLRAFQYNMLPELNKVNGDALLEQQVRKAWFNSKHGGTRWTIVSEGAGGGEKPDMEEPELTATEVDWLLQLNIDQQAFDNEMAILYSLQWELNAAWWKQGHYNHQNFFIKRKYSNIADEFPPLFDTSKNDTLISRLLAQLQKVNSLAKNLPQPIYTDGGNPQDALLCGIEAFAKQKQLSLGKTLKTIAQPRYWRASNPVVVISGVEAPAAADPDSSLTVRLASQVVTGFTVGGQTVNATALGAVFPSLSNLEAMPQGIGALFQEFLLLDPANAPLIATTLHQTTEAVETVMKAHDPGTYLGVLPDIGLGVWSQSWKPLYMEWEIEYNNIPYVAGEQQNWYFDGSDYVLNANAVKDTKTVQFGGRSLLSPHAKFIFGGCLKDFISTYDALQEKDSLDKMIKTVDDWQFLAQELVNFGDMLSQRDGRAFRRPGFEPVTVDKTTLPLADILGYTGGANDGPYATPSSGQGLVNSVPFIDADTLNDFYGVRQGQMYFTDLRVYDKFGRVLELISSGKDSGLHAAQNFTLICDKALSPKDNLMPSIANPVQLPPRLLQHARLDMLLIDHRDASKLLGLNEDVNPVGGWIIPSHLDQGLLLYSPEGLSLGELRLMNTLAGVKEVQWSAPPHSNINKIDDIKQLAPQVAGFINGILGRNEGEYQALLGVIDSTLWTTDPLGNRNDQNLSILIGRPLALVRTQLSFVLDGQPISDVGWEATFTPQTPEFINYNFGIRLGDQAIRKDGVIGYFVESNYQQCNSVAAPQAEQAYVRQIGPVGTPGGNYINLPFAPENKVNITLLVDPRGTVHATTGILPVKELQIPAQFIDKPLENMEVSFHVNPLLTHTVPSSDIGGQDPLYPNAVSYLPLAEQNGIWSWWEKKIEDTGQSDWQGYTLAKASPNAGLKGVPTALREGLLQLATNIKSGQ